MKKGLENICDAQREWANGLYKQKKVKRNPTQKGWERQLNPTHAHHVWTHSHWEYYGFLVLFNTVAFQYRT